MQHEVLKVKSIEEEPAGQFDSESKEKDGLFQKSNNNVASLDKGSLFLVCFSSRFGQLIKIDSRFLS